ncbi:isocitrate lyase/phosphoenolpyruvate mutase family protein [Streptomyces sp. SID3343]|uniref:isocitrate lyase/phosphoenolpyruvate mutase family protein n=1 Tax=Streptomyces sp. SID3343 TaxID=2690260 RepID=UPI001371B553|nr:isocitrate lyase/phosphoenolpyruvate mutase family protein [Streptomyces sp. SID3343]MYW01138.1 phosphoenolpyruvate phosphomutase [Streptomyces sp. SID3343]
MHHGILALLAERSNLTAIGAHDGMTARLGQNAGFDAIWGSGFEIAASFGVPDANILTMTDQLRQCDIIAQAVDIPIIADCDNGFGNAINAAVTTRMFERHGIAGICIEDNEFPKKCSFYEGVQRNLVPLREHALKIRACKEAQTDPDFFVIARTEALIAGNGIQEALDRAYAYAEAGADAVLVHSKQPVSDELVTFAEKWDSAVPLVAVPTTYDRVSAQELHELGYRIVIFANQAMRSSIKAIEENLRLLRADGRSSILRDRMVSLEHVFDLVGVKELRRDEALYLRGAAEELLTS